MTNLVDKQYLIDELKKIVSRHGSQEAAASFLGISRSYLTHLISGHREINNSVALRLGYEPISRKWRKKSGCEN